MQPRKPRRRSEFENDVYFLLRKRSYSEREHFFYSSSFEFLEAASKNDTHTVSVILQDIGSGYYPRDLIDAQLHSYQQNTALHFAIIKKNVEIIRQLLRCNANVNLQNSSGDTPLHLAARQNNSDLVRQLLNHNANVNLQNSDGDTPLHFAAQQNNSDSVRILLERGANVNLQNHMGSAPIQGCSTKGSCLKEFFNYRTDDNDNGNYGYQLIAAIDLGYTEYVEPLLKAGASVSRRWCTRKNESILHLAVKQNNPDLVRLLIEKGAYIHQYDANQLTPLRLAKKLGYTECQKALDRNHNPRVKEIEKADIEWLSKVMNGNFPQPYSKEENAKNIKLKLFKLVKQIPNEDERQRQLWTLLNANSKGGSLLRIRRLLTNPSITNKSTLRDVAKELQESIKEEGHVYIDDITRASILSDKKLIKNLQRSFGLLFSALQPVITSASPNGRESHRTYRSRG